MALTVMNSAGEIAEYTTGIAPERPDLIADNAKRGVRMVPGSKAAESVEERPEKVRAAVESDDYEEDFGKRLGLTPEQHQGVTDLFKREVGKKNIRRKEAEDFAATQYNDRMLAEDRATGLQKEIERLKALTQPVVETAPAGEPQREKFEDDKTYFEALTDWKVDQKFLAREVAQANAAEVTRQQEIMSTAIARIDHAKSIVPDYEEVTSASDAFVPAHIAGYMQESVMFAELGYHFAKFPEELQHISAMPTKTSSDLVRVGIALDKIESKLRPFALANGKQDAKALNGHAPSAESRSDTGSFPTQPRAVSPVITPLNIGSGSQVDKPANRMSYDEAKADFEKKSGRNFAKRSRH